MASCSTLNNLLELVANFCHKHGSRLQRSAASMPSKTTTALLAVGLLALLAVSACTAEPRTMPGDDTTADIMTAGGLRGRRALLDNKGRDRHDRHDRRDHDDQRHRDHDWYCWYDGHRYEPYTYHHGYYCCYGGNWYNYKCW